MTSRKNRYSCHSAGVGCHFFHIKPHLASFLPRFSGIWQRFSRILSRFLRILPGFSPNQKKKLLGVRLHHNSCKGRNETRASTPFGLSGTLVRHRRESRTHVSWRALSFIASWISGVAAFPSDV